MKKRGFAAIGIILVLLIILIVVGGVWYYEARQSLPSAPVDSAPLSTSTAGTTGQNPANTIQASSSAQNVLTKTYFDVQSCNIRIERSSTAPDATGTVLEFCGHQLASSTVYGTVTNPSHFSAGTIVNGDLYLIKSSNPMQPASIYDTVYPQNEIWLYHGSMPVRLVYTLPTNGTSSIGNVLSVSPDENWLAFVNGYDLDVINASGTILKSFRGIEYEYGQGSPGVPIGWGMNSLWVDISVPTDPGYMRINLGDWSTTQYYPTVESVLTTDLDLNYDTGELAVSNVPWQGGFPTGYQPSATATISLFVEDLLTGVTQTIATVPASSLGAFDPRWIGDHVLRYYITNGIATTTTSY